MVTALSPAQKFVTSLESLAAVTLSKAGVNHPQVKALDYNDFCHPKLAVTGQVKLQATGREQPFSLIFGLYNLNGAGRGYAAYENGAEINSLGEGIESRVFAAFEAVARAAGVRVVKAPDLRHGQELFPGDAPLTTEKRGALAAAGYRWEGTSLPGFDMGYWIKQF